MIIEETGEEWMPSRREFSSSPGFSKEEKRPREKEFCGVCEYDEALIAPDMEGDLATKIDLALSKLDKLDTIEKAWTA